MKNLNSIGLDNNKSEELAKKLNTLLANYSIFYQNTRGSHWNIRGQKFFELHVKFEELYNNLVLKIDEIAERIVTLGHIADHRFSDYKNISSIPESTQVSDGFEAVNASATRGALRGTDRTHGGLLGGSDRLDRGR